MKLYMASDLPVGRALTSSVLGMAIVFLALIALMVVVVLLSKAMKTGKKLSLQSASEASAHKIEGPPIPAQPQSGPASVSQPAPEAPKTLAPGSAGPLVLRDVEDKDAALLMAVVAYRMKKPLCQLRFISIKQVYDTGGSK